MPSRNRMTRLLGTLAPLLLAGALAGQAPAAASAATCVSWTGGAVPNPGPDGNAFNAVAVLSPCNAWAAGYSLTGGTFQTLIEHWDGADWTVTPTPNPSTIDNELSGIRAVFANDVWAVGETASNDGKQPLILHWNGTAWSAVSTPTLASGSELSAVRTVSANDVWAVGDVDLGAKTLVLHWNGTAWSRVPSPAPGVSSTLTGVAATSATNAWAVGRFSPDGGSQQTLIEHWDGSKWARVTSPSPVSGQLSAVAATSAANAWAVGYTGSTVSSRTLILHWDGTKWARMASPSPGPAGNDNFLFGVAASSASSAYAVGAFFTSNNNVEQTLLLRWDGSKWAHVASAAPGTGSAFQAVAATSASTWTVGWFTGPRATEILAAHCC